MYPNQEKPQGMINEEKIETAIERFYEELCRAANTIIRQHDCNFKKAERDHVISTNKLIGLKDPSKAWALASKREEAANEMATEREILDQLRDLTAPINEALNEIKSKYWVNEDSEEE